jgi:hypothetical protein
MVPRAGSCSRNALNIRKSTASENGSKLPEILRFLIVACPGTISPEREDRIPEVEGIAR